MIFNSNLKKYFINRILSAGNLTKLVLASAVFYYRPDPFEVPFSQ